ncbi:MAG: ABC transporter substrate-binding protein [Rhodospirillales bacterium RIFCSPLOWO2_12_FULL_67_15]|nr:MAG: ABC transporter substrate-binding protein [Rhodospirillales bacterium RIFCSPLOWO2_12_FULL_67_15]
MKLHLAVVAAAAAAALLLPASAEAQAPKKGGILKFAVSAEPPDYDCHKNTSFAFIHPVRPHYSTLLKFDDKKYPAVVGDLAQSWQVSPDNLAFTFKLKPNVKFHDGSALTSADVKASYERIVNPPPGVISIRRASYADIGAIETPDPLTVVFKLKTANAGMLAQFASPWDCIYSAAKLKQDPKFPEKNILGTGPFKFAGHTAGSHWIGERFADYFEPGKPYLDGFRAVFIGGAAMVNALQAGEVLVEFRGQSPANRDKLKAALGDKITVVETPWVCNLVVGFNTEKKPFNDARVRKALSLAIDRWQGSQALSKIALVRDVGGVLRPGYELAAKESELMQLPGFGKDIKKSRDEAKKLLKDAGVPDLKFKLTNRNVPMPYTPVGVFLIDQWRQIGLNVEHAQLETKLYQAALSGGNYEAGLDFNCDYMDEPNILLIKYVSADKSSVNYGRYKDAKLDELYEKQMRATDVKERYRLIREFEKHALEQAYTIPTIWWHRIIVYWKQLKGWELMPSHYVGQDLAAVWLDQ